MSGVVVALGVGACATEGAEDTPADDAEADTVTEISYATSFGTFGRDAYVYVADAHGHFEDAGLEVDIVPGGGSVDNAQLIAQGQLEFAPIDFASTAIVRANEEVPVKIVSFVHQDALTAILAPEGAGIEEPGELEGRTLAGAPAGADTLLFGPYADAAGFDGDAVDFRPTEPPQLPQILAGGEADAVQQFVVGIPLFEQATDDDIVAFPYADHIPDLPGLGIAASDDLIEEDPELITRFVTALNHGLQEALDDPEEAATVMEERVDEVDVDIAARELEIMRDYVVTDYTEEHGLGHIDESRLESLLDTAEEAFELEQPVSLDEVYEPLAP
ncbi:ABC transporter substrate-binding protein [Egibacter rhizosphaerae]|uniref:ABC transporter substrate-binding protein n=1 Tax=Egibacter rhizosphaerae TaxID=1670831 RepID=UPI0013F14B5C|nr:ABC transporter substrate-binding protein [Egibacter rhizosphaerae]